MMHTGRRLNKASKVSMEQEQKSQFLKSMKIVKTIHGCPSISLTCIKDPNLASCQISFLVPLLQNKSTDFDRENPNFIIIFVQPKNLNS